MATVSKFTRGAVAGNGWTNAANATADDGTYATCIPAKNGTTTGDWDFDAFTGSDIASGSTINSVTIEAQWKISTTSSIETYHQQNFNGGVGGTETTDTTGTTADKVTQTTSWSSTPSETDVKTAGQLVATIKGQRGNSNTAVTFSLDYIKVTVDYTAPTNITVTPGVASLTLTTFAPVVSTSNPQALVVIGGGGTPTSGDNTVKSQLEGLGYTVTFRDCALSADFNYDVIVLCESCASGTLINKYNNSTAPVVVLEPGVAGDMDFGADGTVGGSEDNIVILDSSHGMAGGFSGTVLVQPTATRIDYLPAASLAASAQQVYSVEALSTNIAGFGYESGATMANSHVAEARRAYVGLFPDASISGLNANGLALLDAAVQWVTNTAGITVTPGVVALTLTTFAPTVTATDFKLVTPGVASLTLTTFAPSVTIGVNVVPPTKALTLTTFAPTITATNNQTATPGVLALALTTFAPTVTVTDHKLVTPGVAALTLTTFAPTVTAAGNQVATPGVASLTLTAFAPTVTATNNQTVVPGVASLTLTTFAPTVSAGNAQTVTPGTASLTITAFAPTVTATDHKTVTPTTATLVTATFAPTVTASDFKLVTPGVAALVLTGFAPTVTAGTGTIADGTATLTVVLLMDATPTVFDGAVATASIDLLNTATASVS